MKQQTRTNVVPKKTVSVPKPVPKEQPKKPAPVKTNSKTSSIMKSAPQPRASIGTEKTQNEKMEVAQASKGLAKHEHHENRGSKRYVDTLSAYAKSMLSPFEYGPAQIPDANTFPSACLRITQKFQITASVNTSDTNLGHSVAICLGSVYNNTSNAAPNNANGYRGGNILPMPTRMATTSVDTVLRGFGSYGSGIAAGGYLFSGGTAVNPIVNSAFGTTYDFGNQVSNGYAEDIDLFRPVNAAIKVTAIGPMLTRSGVFVGASFPRSGIMDNCDFATASFNKIMNHPTAQLLPVNSGRALEVHYSPTDNVNYEYLDPAFHPDDIGQAYDLNRGELWIVGYGLQPDESVLIEITVGMEFIPKTAILEFVDVNPSFSHTREMDQAENLAAIVPKVMQSDMTDSDILDAQALMSSPSTPLTRPKTLSVYSSYTSFGSLLKKEKESKKMNTKIGQVVHDGLKDAKHVVKTGRSLLSEIIASVSDVMKFV